MSNLVINKNCSNCKWYDFEFGCNETCYGCFDCDCFELK